jgi:two-component system sensor histidine kinase TctE
MMLRWAGWHPRAGSLRGFLLLWLLGGLWGSVVVLTLWHVGCAVQRLGQRQDERLLAALNAWPRPVPAGIYMRWSAMSGELLSGDPMLPAFSSAATLPAGGAAVSYVTHLQGVLVLAAARSAPAADGRAAVLQVAAPWSERLPGRRELLMHSSPLGWVYYLALITSAVVVSGVSVAERWLRATGGALHEPDARFSRYDGPTELQAAAARMHELRDSQSRWVEEQRRFLADVTHQLRTPMAVLRTQLQSAIAGNVLPGDVLPQMLHTVDRAAGLANQLLSLTKVEQLKRSGNLQPANLHQVARDVVVELAPLVAAKRLAFALEGPELRAPADAALLGELLRNLLANAIHHAPTHGRLGILLRDGTGRTEIVVWDEGPGIDDAVRPRLFQPFSASKGGVGLGLSICRQIAEAIGASVHLYSRIDRGTVIGVDAVVAWNRGP